MTETATPDRAALLEALIEFALFQCACTPASFRPENRGESGARPEDAQAPLMTEAFLYPLLGKEDARSVLAHFRAIQAAAGIDPMAFRTAFNQAYRARCEISLQVACPDRDSLQRIRAIARDLTPPGQIRCHLDKRAHHLHLTPLSCEQAPQIAEALSDAGHPVQETRHRIMPRHELDPAQGA